MNSVLPENQAPFTIAEICRVTQGSSEFDGATTVRGVATDTRSRLFGKLFVALSGPRFDGHDFLNQAVENGAAALLVCGSRSVSVAGIPVIRVDSPLQALGKLSSFHRRRWPGTLIGVAGSAGKTTTRSAIACVLHELYPGQVHSPPGNLNNQIGVPLVLLGLSPEHRFAVIEIGTNRPGEVGLLGSLAQPEIGVLTLIDFEHSEGLGGLDAIAREEGDLLRALGPLGIAVVNGDDDRIEKELARSQVRTVIRVGCQERSADSYSSGQNSTDAVGERIEVAYRILGHRTTASLKTSFELGRGPLERIELEVPLLGAAGVFASSFAIAVAEQLAGRPLSSEELARSARAIRGEVGRLVPTLLTSGTLILDDTYNANPPSMRSSIRLARELADAERRELVLVLGEMRELGSFSESAHRELGELAGRSGARTVVAIGPECRPLCDAARRFTVAVEYAASTAAARPILERSLKAGDVVLLKASRALHLEELAAWLRSREQAAESDPPSAGGAA